MLVNGNQPRRHQRIAIDASAAMPQFSPILVEKARLSYVGSPFEHDIFVSYAHGVPVGNVVPLRTWSICLVDELKAAILNTRIEFAPLAIYLDRDRDPTLGLTADLKAKVKASAILLIVMSPFFVESSWCRDEGAWFQAQLQARGRGNGFLFVVRAMPTDGKDWPPYLKDERGHPLLGFPFHQSGYDAKPYGWYHPLPDNPRHSPFYEQLESLSGAVMRRLRELRGHHKQLAQQVERFMGGFRPPSRLYLSARPDHTPAWQEVRDYLAACGFEIRPDPQRAAEANTEIDFADRRLAECSECDAVLILRAMPGDWINQEIAAARIDRAMIQAEYGKRLPFLILDRVGGNLPTAEQFKLPVIPANVPGWMMQLQAYLSAASARELVI